MELKIQCHYCDRIDYAEPFQLHEDEATLRYDNLPVGWSFYPPDSTDQVVGCHECVKDLPTTQDVLVAIQYVVHAAAGPLGPGDRQLDIVSAWLRHVNEEGIDISTPSTSGGST